MDCKFQDVGLLEAFGDTQLRPDIVLGVDFLSPARINLSEVVGLASQPGDEAGELGLVPGRIDVEPDGLRADVHGDDGLGAFVSGARGEGHGGRCEDQQGGKQGKHGESDESVREREREVWEREKEESWKSVVFD